MNALTHPTPGGLGQQRRKPQHPAVDGDVVDLDATFGQQLLNVAVRQRETQIPTHRQHDHVGWEAEAGERSPYDRGGAGMASLIATVCLLWARSQQMQQGPVDCQFGQVGRMTVMPSWLAAAAIRSS